MTSKDKVYIAGVGYSPFPSGSSSAKVGVASLISAATKALLDAGVTYDDVTKGVRGKGLKDGSKAFKAFDEGGITVDEAQDGSEMESSVRLIKDQGAQCVLMIAAEKSAAIASVLVSDKFLWSRPYLKDSAALIRQASASRSGGNEQAGLYEACKAVWTLRGWSDSKSTQGSEKPLHYRSFELSRADAQAIPKWEDIEHRQDGKHRLRYNPARDTKDISQEDFEAVKAIGKGLKKAGDFESMGGDGAALAKL